MTDFHCCDHMRWFCEEEEFTVKEVAEEYDWTYCPFCRDQLSHNF